MLAIIYHPISTSTWLYDAIFVYLGHVGFTQLGLGAMTLGVQKTISKSEAPGEAPAVIPDDFQVDKDARYTGSATWL